MTKYSEEQLANLIQEVETNFSQALEKMEADKQDLQKSEQETPESNNEVSYDEEDIQEMDKLYASMTKSEQKAHYEAIKKHVKEEAEMKKSEEAPKEEPKNEDTSLLKSEVETLKNQNQELQKSQDKLVGMLKDFFSKTKAPARKAVTSVEYIKKSEAEDNKDASNLSRNEISQVLTKKIRNGEVKKSEDREAINDFYMKNTSIETIKHLL